MLTKIKADSVLVFALLLAWWLACWLATSVYFDGEAQEAYRTEGARAERFVADAVPSYNRILLTHSGVPRVLARDPDIHRTLARFGPEPLPAPTNEEERRRRWSADPDLAQTSKLLQISARELGFDVLVLLNANGDCVAASNAGSARSIVGASYGDRADFQSARAGRSGYLTSAGQRMGGTGVSFYAPVMDHGRFIGVVTGGNALAPLINLIDQADAFLSDRNGVVLLARDPLFMLQALPGAPAGRLENAARQALYLRTELTTLVFEPWGNMHFPELLRVPGRAAPVILRSGSVADGGLTVSVLWAIPQLLALTQRRLAYVGAVGTIGTLLLMLALVYVTRRNEQRAMALALAEREQRVLDSRNFLDQIVNAIADPIFVKDRAHRFVLVNQSFCEFLGQPREHFIGKSDLDVLPEREARIFWDTDERVLTGGIESVNEEKLTDSQGRARIVVTKKARCTDAAGQRFVVGIVSDISERKQVERLLRAREREFRTLAENNPDVIIRYDRGCQRTYVNQTLATLAGQKAGELVDRLPYDHTPLIDPEGYMAKLREVMDSGTPSHFEVTVRRANGEAGWYASSIVAEFDEVGQVVGALTVARDITEIKQAQAQMSRFIANVPGFVYSFRMSPGHHWSFPFASPGIEDIFGMRPEDLIYDAAPIFQIFHPDDLERGRVELRTSARDLTPFHTEYRVRRPGMPERWIEARALPERETDGSTLWHGIQIDITARKQMQALLERREHEFHSLVENLPVTVIRYDPECRRRYINPSAQRMLHGNTTELLGLAPGEGGVPASSEMIAHYRGRMEEALATDTAQDLDFVLDALPADQQKHYEVRFVPEHGADGKTVGVLAIWYDLTERKQVECLLRAREQAFRTLAENSPDPIYRYDRDCRRLYVNPVVGRILGKPVESLIGSSPADGAVLVSEQNKKLMLAIRRAFDSGQTLHHDLDFIAPSGQHRDYDMLLVPERDTDGQVVTVLAIARDISTIRDAGRRMSQFLGNVPGFVFTFRMSPNGHFSFPFVSAGIKDIYGLNPEDVKDDVAPLRALVHAEDVRRIENSLARSARTMSQLQVEFRVQCPDRPECWVECRCTAEREADGGILWHGIMLDITERKRLETALVQRENEFRTLVENSPDIVTRYDRECRHTYCNPAALKFMGVLQADIVGKTTAEFSPYPADVAIAVAALVRQVIDSGQADEMALEWAKMDEPVWLQFRVSPEFDNAGQVVSALAVGRDITALKLAEQRLRQSRDIMRALAAHQETEHEKTRRELAFQIHEDLAQNLVALRMNISLFEMGGESASRAPLLKTMDSIAERSIVRIRDIVSMLRPTVLDLGLVPALHWLINDFKGVGFQFDQYLQEDILFGDEASIFLFRASQEVLINIALHAAATHVYISLDNVAGLCRLVVRDNGCGFDPALPYRKGSFGLIGLTEQARHLGGDLVIDSTCGHGTAVEILVPAFKATTPASHVENIG